MLPPPPVTPLLLVLLVGGSAVAQPGPTPGAPSVRHIELAEEEPNSTHEVEISPGLTTAFRFHGAPLDRERVTLQERERLWVSIADESILLVPSERVSPGQRLRLTVPFKGGVGAASASFILVVHSAVAERQVEVHRQPSPSAVLRAAMREKDAQLRSCHELVDRLRAGRTPPGGLSGLIATRQLDAMGVLVQELRETEPPLPGGHLGVRTARSFRSARRVAVELWLEVAEGVGPWIVEGARLWGGTGESLTGLTVWQDASVSSGTARRVVVEADATADVARTSFSLELWGEGGRHSVTLGNVRFP